MKSLRTLVSLLLLITGVVLLFALPAPKASADLTGGCVATVGGANANDIDTPGTALDVDYADDVPVTMTSPLPLASHRVQMEWTGLRWTVSDQADNGTDTSWSDTVAVSDYAKYGVGIYKIWAVGEQVGGAECEGEIYVNVTNKSPISTPVGAAAAAAAAAGAVALAAASFAAWQQAQAAKAAANDNCCSITMLPALLLTTAAMTTGGGMKPAGGATPAGGAPPTPTPTGGSTRKSMKPRISVLGVGGGFIGSIGGLIYLQQSGSVYPTLTTTSASVIVGLALGIGLPTAIKMMRSGNK